MKEKTLYILVGAPGSGKSTWRRGWHGEYVNPDAIRREKFGVQYDRRLEPAVWKMAYEKLEKIMEEGRDVCFDATGLTPEARRPLLQMARRHGYISKAVYFDVSLATLLKRNENRPSGKILEPEIIGGLYMKQKPPALEEGFDEIQVISEEEQGDGEPGLGEKGEPGTGEKEESKPGEKGELRSGEKGEPGPLKKGI